MTIEEIMQGGHWVIGVEDTTRKVIGVDRDSVFQVMDSIANAAADSCVPQIVPDIELQTIEGHTVVVVTVSPEPNRPYYLKSKGNHERALKTQEQNDCKYL